MTSCASKLNKYLSVASIYSLINTIKEIKLNVTSNIPDDYINYVVTVYDSTTSKNILFNTENSSTLIYSVHFNVNMENPITPDITLFVRDTTTETNINIDTIPHISDCGKIIINTVENYRQNKWNVVESFFE